jgi:hypothetical protein
MYFFKNTDTRKIVRVLSFMVFFISAPFIIHGQQIIIGEGSGVGALKIGQSFEEAVKILGFTGDLKTYDDYLAEELFNEDPEIAFECVLGFDYYIKYTHLLTIPVSYVFFKDNELTQIMVSSFPEYYFAIARDSRTKKGLDFWAESKAVKEIYGTPELEVDYDGMILDAYFYFDQGITIDLRDNSYRMAHIYRIPDKSLIKKFADRF